MDVIKDYWALIVWSLGMAAWLGKLQRDVQALQRETFVTNDRCGERRTEINTLTDVKFSHESERLLEIKKLIEEQNRAVLLLNSENDKRLSTVNDLAEERFNRLLELIKKNGG